MVQWPSFERADRSSEPDCQEMMLHALAAAGSSYPGLAEAQTSFEDRKFFRELLAAYPLYIDGWPRKVDLTEVIPEEMLKSAERQQHSEPSHYDKLVDGRKWREAVEEAVRMAEGNPSWMSAITKIGARSVQEVGLAETLQWCATIDDLEIRWRAEVAAMQEAVKHRRRLLPAFDARKPSFVVPTIGWPSGC